MKTNRLAAGLALITASLALPAIARAEVTVSRYRSNDLSAFTYCSETDPETNVSTYFIAGVFKSSFGSGAYVYYSKYDPLTGEECTGYAEVPAGSTSLTLASASISSTTLTLTCGTWVVDPDTGYSVFVPNGETEEVTVSVNWSASGNFVRNSYSSTFQDPPFYRSTYSFSGQSRTATMTVLVDGEEHSNCSGSIGRGRYSQTVIYDPTP